MDLKELFTRHLKGEKIAGVRDEFTALRDNCVKKKKLLDDLRDGEIFEEDFKKKFKPLLELDDVLLSLEQKLLKNFPGNEDIKLDVQVLRANIDKQKEMLSSPAPLNQDHLRAVVAEQFYTIYSEEEHKRKKAKPAPAEAPRATEAPTGWQYPADFFSGGAWHKPQAALEFFKDIIWNIHRIILPEKGYDSYQIMGSMQAWATKHLLGPFPNLELLTDTLMYLSKKCKRRRIGDVILAFKNLPDPVNLTKFTLSRKLFVDKWSEVRKTVSKLPDEVQEFLQNPVGIIDQFTKFLETAGVADVEPMQIEEMPLEEHEPELSLRIIGEFSSGEDFDGQRNAAERAARFMALVGRSVLMLIDDPEATPRVVELLKRYPEIDYPGDFAQNMKKLAVKKNRKHWEKAMVASINLEKLFKKLPEKVGFWKFKSLRKSVDSFEDALASSEALAYDFIKDPFRAVKKVYERVVKVKKAA